LFHDFEDHSELGLRHSLGLNLVFDVNEASWFALILDFNKLFSKYFGCTQYEIGSVI
jgi:hypothetical protein